MNQTMRKMSERLDRLEAQMEKVGAKQMEISQFFARAANGLRFVERIAAEDAKRTWVHEKADVFQEAKEDA